MPTSVNFTGSSLLEDETVVLKDYVIGHRLGEGTYGTVYAATYVPSGEKFALKILPKTNFQGIEEKIVQEAIVMQSLEHTHVVKLIKFLQSTVAFYLLLELAEGGELFDLIISKRHFCESVARQYFQQLMSAIDYCHSHGVAHRDLKAENMLLSKNQKLLVCDFGFSSKSGFGGANSSDSDICDDFRNFGTLHYTSPEALSHGSDSTAVDIFQQDLWSAGVLLFFMLTGRLSFEGRGDEETIYLIEKCVIYFTEEEEQYLSTEVRSLLGRMHAFEPTERLTLEQIIEHPWFNKDLDVSLFPHRTFSTSSTFLDFSTQHRVTQEEEAVLKKAFQIIDIDGYGKITHDQIRDILITLHGKRVGADDVCELVKLFTGNSKSSTITYTQFRNAWVRKDLAHCAFKRKNDFQLSKIVDMQVSCVEPHVVRQLRSAFNSVDDVHTGCIDVGKWQRLFKRCDISVSEKEILSLMRFFVESEMEHGGEITFAMFLFGVLNREMLVRHPMGRKLAIATNLAALLQSRKVTECVRHGFFVVGQQSAILSTLSARPERLVLLYPDEPSADPERICSFRFLGAAALGTGKTMESVTPQFAAAAAPGLGASAESFLLSGSDGGFLSLPPGRSASALARRELVYGSGGAVCAMNGVCDVDVILVAATLGYTLVRFRRIYGNTQDFHEGVAFISSILEKERQQAMEDTLPSGESELL